MAAEAWNSHGSYPNLPPIAHPMLSRTKTSGYPPMQANAFDVPNKPSLERTKFSNYPPMQANAFGLPKNQPSFYHTYAHHYPTFLSKPKSKSKSHKKSKSKSKSKSNNKSTRRSLGNHIRPTPGASLVFHNFKTGERLPEPILVPHSIMIPRSSANMIEFPMRKLRERRLKSKKSGH